MARSNPIILPLGYSEAAMFLRTPEAARVKAILSIHGTHEHGIESNIPLRLDLHFDDIAAPDPADHIGAYHARMRRQECEANGLSAIPPTPEHARAILDFATATQNLDGIILCHCSGGISRSPAAALLCLAQWIGPGNEQDAVAALATVRPSASPHEDLVRFGDTILNRQGRLMPPCEKFCTERNLDDLW